MSSTLASVCERDSVRARFEHVGSTSVPGLGVKPIVDISVGVDDADDDAAFVPALIGAGYSLRVIKPEHRDAPLPATRCPRVA